MQDVPLNPSQWATDVGALAAVVGFAVSFIRKHLAPGLDGLAVVGTSLAVGVAAAYGLDLAGYRVPEHPFAYGLQAGLVASGATAYLKNLLKVGK